MAINIEDHLPVIKQAGLNTKKASNLAGVTIDKNGNVVVPGNLTISGTTFTDNEASTITSPSANALAVGPNGTTNPSLNIDASTTSAATGINIKSAAANSGVTVSVLSSQGNENLTLQAKGIAQIIIPFTNAQNGVNVQTQLFVLGGNANMLEVGSTQAHPAFNVDSSVASQVTGVNVQGQAAGTKPILSVISSDAALGLVLQALTTTNSLTINDTLAAATNPLLLGVATDVITGAVTDAFTGGLRLTPTINAATAQTVTRYNYIDVNTPTLGGVGPAAVTDAAVFRFNANAGTHKAVDAGTTKTSPGTVTQWVKINVNGTLAYIPSYSSKTS